MLARSATISCTKRNSAISQGEFSNFQKICYGDTCTASGVCPVMSPWQLTAEEKTMTKQTSAKTDPTQRTKPTTSLFQPAKEWRPVESVEIPEAEHNPCTPQSIKSCIPHAALKVVHRTQQWPSGLVVAMLGNFVGSKTKE